MMDTAVLIAIIAALIVIVKTSSFEYIKYVYLVICVYACSRVLEALFKLGGVM